MIELVDVKFHCKEHHAAEVLAAHPIPSLHVSYFQEHSQCFTCLQFVLLTVTWSFSICFIKCKFS